MTGFDWFQQAQEQIGKDYSVYYDTLRANDLVVQAFYKTVEKKYPDIISAKNTDELFTLIRTDVSYTPTNNQLNLVTGVTDYLHDLALKATFEYYIANVRTASNQSPIILTLDRITDLRDGDLLSITGVLGNTNANGQRYVKKLYDNFVSNIYAYQLYSDAKLLVPVSGNGAYASGGSVKKILSGWTKKKNSYRKISVFGTPTLSNVFYEIADGFLKILPSSEVCTEVRFDYVKKQSIPIDVTDTTVVLEDFYSLPLLYALIDEFSLLASYQSRDTGLSNSATIQLTQE